jgi:hypothetical protein
LIGDRVRLYRETLNLLFQEWLCENKKAPCGE